MEIKRRTRLYRAAILRETDGRGSTIPDPWCVCGANQGFELVHHEWTVYRVEACRRCGSLRYEDGTYQTFYRKSMEIREREFPDEVLFFETMRRRIWVARVLDLGNKFGEIADTAILRDAWSENSEALRAAGCQLPEWAKEAA